MWSHCVNDKFFVEHLLLLKQRNTNKSTILCRNIHMDTSTNQSIIQSEFQFIINRAVKIYVTSFTYIELLH